MESSGFSLVGASAFGNSDSDMQRSEYTLAGEGP